MHAELHHSWCPPRVVMSFIKGMSNVRIGYNLLAVLFLVIVTAPRLWAEDGSNGLYNDEHFHIPQPKGNSRIVGRR